MAEREYTTLFSKIKTTFHSEWNGKSSLFIEIHFAKLKHTFFRGLCLALILSLIS